MNKSETQRERHRLLKEAYLKKRERNPRFTIRAFAAQLGMNSGTLSRLLSEKQPISEKVFEKIRDVVIAEVPWSASQYEMIPKIDIEIFRLITRWYHFAILELTYLKDFQSDIQWIAKRLNISIIEADDAVRRLFRLEFLKEDPEGRWVDTQADLSTVGTVDTHQALKMYQHEVLDLAKTALDHISSKERDCTSLTVSMNSSMIEEVRKILSTARRQINALSAQSADRDEVYQLSLAFFPLTQKRKEI